MYGYNEKNVSYGVLGLNTGFLTKFEFVQEEKFNCVEVGVNISGKEYTRKYFEVAKVFKDNVEITDKNSIEYKEEIEKQEKALSATLCDFAKVFVSKEELEEALKVQINSFKDFVNILERVIKNKQDWNKIPVDIFLQYQFTPSSGQNRTYLELPKNLNHGQFICKSLGGDFNPVKTETSLTYVNKDGIVHPFKRNKWFIQSNFYNKIEIQDNDAENANKMNNNTNQNDNSIGW